MSTDHNAESSHGHGNAIIFFDQQYDHNDDHSLGSVYSKEGSKGNNQDSAILYQVRSTQPKYFIFSFEMKPDSFLTWRQGFGAKGRVFCGVFDGHGKDGRLASEMARNRLPALLLSQLGKSEKITESCEEWNEAITSAFEAMDREIKIQENLDFVRSGTTAVVAIRKVKQRKIARKLDQFFFNK